MAASGGADARIVVIPTASSLGDEVVEVYDALFRRLGAGEVGAVPARAAATTRTTPTWWRWSTTPPASS